jgi:hypothetical protein
MRDWQPHGDSNCDMDNNSTIRNGYAYPGDSQPHADGIQYACANVHVHINGNCDSYPFEYSNGNFHSNNGSAILRSEIYARNMYFPRAMKKPYWLIVPFVFVCLAVLVTAAYPPILGNSFVLASEERHMMVNCANPDGVVVKETGRVIAEGETFEVIGYEIIEEDGSTYWRVEDGVINADFVCEFQEDGP